jgi:hypothetical protein
MQSGPLPSAAASAASGAPRIIVERPPPGLARGKYGAPAWAVGAFGTAAVLLGVAFLLWRARRRAAR